MCSVIERGFQISSLDLIIISKGYLTLQNREDGSIDQITFSELYLKKFRKARIHSALIALDMTMLYI